MQIRENYLYVRMDLHKKTHTAVLVNCWNEKLDTLVIENKPVEFEKLVKRVNRKALTLGLIPIEKYLYTFLIMYTICVIIHTISK